MERLTDTVTYFAVLGEATIGTIVIAAFGLLGTFATVGYKYKRNKPHPTDQSKMLFDQVNQFIEQQKQDREILRKELQEVKQKLEAVEQESRNKDAEIYKLRVDNNELREEIDELRQALGHKEDKNVL